MTRMFAKVGWHYRNGTLWYALKKKLVGSAHRKPKGNQYYGDIADSYLEIREKQEKWQVEQRIMRELLADIPSGLKVLDVPFGTGRFVPFYLEKKMTVHGVDISQDMVCAAEKALGDE